MLPQARALIGEGTQSQVFRDTILGIPFAFKVQPLDSISLASELAAVRAPIPHVVQRLHHDVVGIGDPFGLFMGTRQGFAKGPSNV